MTNIEHCHLQNFQLIFKMLVAILFLRQYFLEFQLEDSLRIYCCYSAAIPQLFSGYAATADF